MTLLARPKALVRLACAGFIALAAGSASRGPVLGTVDRGVALGAPARDLERRVGSIEGVVTREQRPQRRVVNRYPSGGAPSPLPLQELPTFAYIDGPIAGPPAAATRGFQIAQQDSTFVPAALVVPVGSTVSFPNQDPIFHNVFSYSTAKRFDLGRYPRGESKSVVFDELGVVKIFCEVHEHMRSAVIVVQNPFHAEVGSDGRFRIVNVPAGRHKLVIWNADLDPQEVEVTVPENGVARVQVTLS
jgi:plastocyanin